jgi:hypothetical protein
MNIMKTLESGLKFFGIALAGGIIAALTIAGTGYVPEGPIGQLFYQYALAPLIAGIIGAAQNFIKNNTKEAK